MTTSRGFFGIGVFHPKHECNIGTLWRSAYAFHASFIYTIGRRFQKQASDTPQAWRSVPMFHFSTIDDLIEHLPFSCPLVAVELVDGATPLNRFCHPQRACYLLGAEDHGLPQSVIERCSFSLVVPHARICLNVSTTGSLVLYDRQVKSARAARKEISKIPIAL